MTENIVISQTYVFDQLLDLDKFMDEKASPVTEAKSITSAGGALKPFIQRCFGFVPKRRITRELLEVHHGVANAIAEAQSKRFEKVA